MPLVGERERPKTTAVGTWEDQPIRTDAARIERERERTRLDEDRRRREARDRQFQEELLQFRRHTSHAGS